MIENTLAWIGTALYLINHAVFSAWPAFPKRFYYGLNFVAAILVLIGSLMMATWQPVAVNGFWAAISLWGLLSQINLAIKVPGSYLSWPVGFLITTSLALFPFFPFMAAELAGWVSVLAFAGSYLLFTGQAISRHYFLLYNVVAACIILPILYLKANWPVFSLEIAWAFLSLYALLRERLGSARAILEPEEGIQRNSSKVQE